MTEQQVKELLDLLRAIAQDAAKVRAVIESWDAQGTPSNRING